MAGENLPRVLSQDIGGVELPYLLYEGSGPTLILLHATGFVPWLWHPIARELAPAYRVVAPYFCDHREVEPEEGGLSWMRIAEDLAAFCKRTGIHRPGLVGHSMGATVLTLAHTSFRLDARGLVLIEPIFLPQDFYHLRLSVDEHPLASRSIRRKDTWSSREEALAYLRSKPLFKNWDDEMIELYLDHGMRRDELGSLTLACSPRREASLFMGGMAHDPWPFLPLVECPALVLEGELSENRQYIDLKKATASMKAAEYRLISGAGHLIPMEKPGEISGIVRRFFDGV
ncbi:MAG: alpha/beta hydrolase [Desulfomonilia bacterium]|jgi:lipase